MFANLEHILAGDWGVELDVITNADILIPEIIRSRVNLFEYSTSPRIENILSNLDIDRAYRQGFWRYSLERLFALTEHHKRFPKEQLLHIESDVLILETFPFEALTKITKLAWSIIDDERDVAALLFSATLETSKWLREKVIELLISESNVNDMQILSRVSNRFPNEVTVLPTLPKNYTDILSESCHISDFNKVRSSENAEVFAGVFDAAPIGIWLTGSYGVNSFGVSKRFDNNLAINSNSMINPTKLGLKYLRGSGLFITSDGRQVPIHTLHIHSKDTRIFSSSGSEIILKYVLESRNNRIARRFSSKILRDLFIDNYKKKTLIRFLSWLPPFNKYRIIRDFLLRREN